MRAGELFGLHVDDLDANRGVIHVRRSVWRGQEVSTKTRKGYREVWIDSVTVRINISEGGHLVVSFKAGVGLRSTITMCSGMFFIRSATVSRIRAGACMRFVMAG